MGQNLTGQTIASTYEDLVQISGSILTDGLGANITSITVTSSFASQAGTAGYAATAGTAGFATSASFADQAGTSGYAATAGTAGFATSASFADQSGTAGFVTSASFAIEALTTASVNLNTITFTKGDGTTFPITVDTGSGGGGAAFPYTGSAEITGSLVVTGSQSGLLGDLQGITIYATQSANSLVGNFLIGAQDPSINGLNTGIGINNVVIGNGEFKTDLKGIASGAGDSNAVIGGWGGFIGRGQYNAIVGGGDNKIASGSVTINGNTQYNFIGSGTGHIMGERTTYGAMIAGQNNTIQAAGTNGSTHGAIVAGQTNFISGSDWAGIYSSRNSDITFGNYVVIVGGNNNTAVYGTSTSAYSAMLAGNGNTLTHSRSVVIGGTGLASTKNDEVVVPNLTAVGDVIVTGSVTSTVGFTGSLEGAASLLDVTVGGTSDPYNIIFGETGTGKILRGDAQLTYNPVTDTLSVVNNIITTKLTISGSAVGEVNTLSITSQTASLDCSAGNFFTLQLASGSDTHINPSNIQAGQTLNIRVNTTGSGTVSFPSSVLQVSGSSYVPTTTTGVDIITLISYDTSNLYLSNIKNFI